MTYNCCAITTKDNPFDPLKDFDKWFRFDCDKGYYSCNKLARVSHTSEALSEAEYCKEVERAIDKIIECDPLHIYRKVKKRITVSEQ